MIIQSLNLAYIVLTLGLVALGLAISFGLLQVLNMAHGEFVMLGAYSVFFVQQMGLPFLVAIPLCVIVSGIIALMIERGILKNLYHRHFDTLLATWGCSILIRHLVEWQFGKQYQNVINPFTQTISIIDGVEYPAYRLVLIVTILIFFVLLFIWYRKSILASQLKAMVENPNLAKMIGIKTNRLATVAFVFSAVITSISGVLLAPLIRVDPHMGLDYLLNSFFVLIVGGLGSLEGLLVGSTVMGSFNNILASAYGQTLSYAGVLILSILFLWLRPHGIFSSNAR